MIVVAALFLHIHVWEITARCDIKSIIIAIHAVMKSESCIGLMTKSYAKSACWRDWRLWNEEIWNESKRLERSIEKY